MSSKMSHDGYNYKTNIIISAKDIPVKQKDKQQKIIS